MQSELGYRHIDAIYAVIVTGSMTGASGFLNITQPAISNLIKEAEDRLGYSLFDRRGGRVIPNHKAELIFKEIERSYTGLRELNKICKSIAASDAHILKITSMPTFGSTILPGAIKRLTASNDATISLVMNRAQNVVSMVNSGKVDIGISINHYSVPGVESEILCALPLNCYVHVDSPLANQMQISPQDLHGQQKISISDLEGIDGIVDFDLVQNNIPTTSHIESPAAISSYALVAQGLGFMIFDKLPALLMRHPNVVVKPYQSNCQLVYKAYWNKANGKIEFIQKLINEIKAEINLTTKSLDTEMGRIQL